MTKKGYTLLAARPSRSQQRHQPGADARRWGALRPGASGLHQPDQAAVQPELCPAGVRSGCGASCCGSRSTTEELWTDWEVKAVRASVTRGANEMHRLMQQQVRPVLAGRCWSPWHHLLRLLWQICCVAAILSELLSDCCLGCWTVAGNGAVFLVSRPLRGCAFRCRRRARSQQT